MFPRTPYLHGLTMPTRSSDRNTNSLFHSVLFKQTRCVGVKHCNDISGHSKPYIAGPSRVCSSSVYMVLRDRLCVVYAIKARAVSRNPGKLMRHTSSRWPRARMQRFTERNAYRPSWILLRAGSGTCLKAASRTSYIPSWFLGSLERSGIATMVLGAMEELRIADRLLSLVLALYRPNHSSKPAMAEGGLDS